MEQGRVEPGVMISALRQVNALGNGLALQRGSGVVCENFGKFKDEPCSSN